MRRIIVVQSEGTIPLTRSLPETSWETKGVFMEADEDGVVASLPESETKDSVAWVSDSGNISHMLSSSLYTSDIEGRASVSSWQHLRATFMNFSTHSDG